MSFLSGLFGSNSQPNSPKNSEGRKRVGCEILDSGSPKMPRVSKSSGVFGFFKGLFGSAEAEISDDCSEPERPIDDEVQIVSATPRGRFNRPREPHVIDLTKDETSIIASDSNSKAPTIVRQDSVICLSDGDIFVVKDGHEDDEDEGEESISFVSDFKTPVLSSRKISRPVGSIQKPPEVVTLSSTDENDDIAIIAEIPGSPVLAQQRKSIETIISAATSGQIYGETDVLSTPCGSDSLSIASGQLTNGFASPTPEDSISRQATPKGFRDASIPSFSDRWRRSSTRPNRSRDVRSPSVLSQGKIKKRVMRELNEETESRPKLSVEAYRKLCEQAGKFISINSNPVFEEGQEYSYSVLRDVPPPGLSRPLNRLRKPAGGRYFERVQKALASAKLPKPRFDSIECQDDESSSNTCVLTESPLTSGFQTPASNSSANSAVRNKLDDLVAEMALHELRHTEGLRNYNKYKCTSTTNMNREMVLLEKAKLCTRSHTISRADIVEDLRKDLDLLGIKVPPKPKAKIDEFPELPGEAIDIYNRVMSSGAESEKFSSGFGLEIARKDLLTLRSLEWLNDEVINFYLQLICDRSANNKSLPKVYSFNTFFYVRLATGGYSTIKRWTRKVDIFSYDVVLVPVHVSKIHWCMAIIDFGEKKVEYFDSLHGSNRACLDNLKSYLCEESLDKKKKEFDLTGWSFQARNDCPSQHNGSDCGVFSCKFADFCARRAEIVFDQSHMEYFRKRMVYEIVTKKLMV